jgi:dsDNA-specific endonuclease/ATPase MutS2
LIVGFIQKFQSRLQQDLVDLSLLNAFSIAKLDSISIKAKSNSAMLINLPTSQRKAMIHFMMAVPSLLSNTSTWRL